MKVKGTDEAYVQVKLEGLQIIHIWDEEIICPRSKQAGLYHNLILVKPGFQIKTAQNLHVNPLVDYSVTSSPV